MPNPASFLELLSAYLRPEDVAQAEEAFRVAEAAHHGQLRQSGEAYISHPLAVATILAEWRMDPQAIMAALLHDVVEDTEITSEALSRQFGKHVADLVEGVSKLDKIEFQSEAHAQAENFRKMLLAMARDVRVILIKLADRLHNMRTMEAMKAAKQQRISNETLEIYAPIANRLGLNNVYRELEDLGFHYAYPNRYTVLSKAVKSARGNRREVVKKVLEAIENKLSICQIGASVTGREKHLYSIYRKMQEKNLAFSEVFDIYGFRVIVKDNQTCYLAMGALHALYKPIPGKFKDYIAIPKANGYQSLHTTLFGPFGTPIEIQIRSKEMHQIAEAGVASHWLYKSGENGISDVQQKTHQWLQNLLEIQDESRDAAEFLEHIKVDLFPDEVYVFTPKGKIMAMPRGVTAVDLAYAIHTDVGNRAVAVKINHEHAPLRTELRNGDHVEIVTASHANPNPAWLNYVVTGKARSHIRHFLKTLHYDESVALGGRLLDQAFRVLQIESGSVGAGAWDKLLRENAGKTQDEILADIGLGKRLNIVVARQLAVMSEAQTGEQRPQTAITIRGTEGMAIQFAKCCRPIPGDPILGLINKGKGLIIHTHDCPGISHFRKDPEKWVDVEWDTSTRRMFEVSIKLVVANQRGVLAKVAATIADADSNIDNVSMEEEDGSAYTTMFFTLQVENRMHLAKVMRGLRQLQDVVRISRLKS
jgi:guanosine-3',5'-bis(diphosphate) 3'-pyrophosphohydrolase